MNRVLLPIFGGIVLSAAAGYFGYRNVDLAIDLLVTSHHADVQIQSADSADDGMVAVGFAGASVFAALAVVAAAVISAPGNGTTRIVPLVLRIAVFLAVGLLAFFSAAVYYRYRFSLFVAEVGTSGRTHEVPLTELPLARIPIIAGLVVLITGAIARSINDRVRQLAPPKGN